MRMETCTRFQRFVRTWGAWCVGTRAKRPGTARVTALALMRWAAWSTARPFPISNASRFPALSAAKARAICLRDAPLGPLCTGAGLCQDATEEILCHAETGRR